METLFFPLASPGSVTKPGILNGSGRCEDIGVPMELVVPCRGTEKSSPEPLNPFSSCFAFASSFDFLSRGSRTSGWLILLICTVFGDFLVEDHPHSLNGLTEVDT